MTTLNNYPGAKSGSGIVQWLINRIPVHDRYFELFAGSAQLYRAKKPAEMSVLSDIDKNVCKVLIEIFQDRSANLSIVNESALNLLDAANNWPVKLSARDFIYLDPPYPKAARRTGKKYYKFEMMENNDHLQLLTSIRTVPANLMISTRQNDLYDQVLSDWRKETFQTADRGGACEEVIYMNYEVPVILHQYDYVGNGFTDRQRIKRKVDRFTSKISMLPDYERHMFIQELIKNDSAAVKHFLSMLDRETK